LFSQQSPDDFGGLFGFIFLVSDGVGLRFTAHTNFLERGDLEGGDMEFEGAVGGSLER